MGFLTALRRSSLPWAGTALLAVTLFYTQFTWDLPQTGFGGDTVSYAVMALGPIPGALAGIAAWEAGRLRVGQVWRLTPARGRYRIALDATRPVIFLAVLINVVVMGSVTVTVSAPPRLEDLPLISVLLAVQAASIIIGFGAGAALPRTIAAPLVTITLTLWAMIPGTLDTPWVRHLNGFFADSSTLTDSIAPSALLAPTLLWAGAAAAVLLAASPLASRLLRAGIAVCCLIATAVPAQALVADAGYRTPTTPRVGHQACDEGTPRICVPEEYADMLPKLRAAATEAVPKLVNAGFDAPDTLAYVSEQASVTGNTWRLRLDRPLTDTRALNVIASALVPLQRWDDCPGLPDDYTGRVSPGPLTAWMRLTAGMDEEKVAKAHSEATVRRVAEIRAQSTAEQKRWADEQAAAMRSCDPKVHQEARR